MLLESGDHSIIIRMYMTAVCCSNPIPQVERFGKPTWRRLVEAVEDRVGGNNPALVQTIAREHPGK